MKVALVNSRQDKAGVNIRHHIEQLLAADPDGRWQERGRTYEFFETEDRLIHTEDVDERINADLVIFLSRHSSVNPVPVLTVHVTGNYGAAELGGSARTLAPAAPAMMQATLRALAKHCPEGYRVSYEVTHHGPTALHHPSFFVEIGSTEKEWTDPVAGRAVAEAVLDAVPINAVPLIGFGGTHYAVRQTEIALTSRGAFGHIAHTREIAGLDADMIRSMQAQSGAVAAYIDRKALDRTVFESLSGLLDQLAIPRLSESEISAIGPLSWNTYQAVRAMAEAVSPGARCYIHALRGEGELSLIRANPVLLAETAKSDEPGLIKDLDNLPVVHLSTRDNRLLPEFITYNEHLPEIINDLNTLCVKIIRNKEITVTESDHLIITKVRFDPEKARNLGVPPGPAYKKLAAGQSIEINGQEITPAMVSLRSETDIHIPGLEKFS
ncbi:MAG: D-tyrosyl-tRNA(Tyr) deacylase [Methanomicrobiales archaeon HGW-Methanomicrobiales-1]|jgi:D-aminoacyl-tRNA deacylase|nr:MAG: D-tyrosyl-tRNA(Tyr) deacylase [Methanomicrobiales archaeon HGW-Methanomicrobiales-1]